MPALPWINVETPAHDVDLTIMASKLPLRSHRHVPRFLWHTWLVHRQLARSPGLVAYSLDARLLDKTFWTVSAWKTRPDLGGFDRSGPHRAAKDAIRPAMLPSTFVMWRCRADALPPTWQEVRGRIEAAATRPDEDATQPTSRPSVSMSEYGARPSRPASASEPTGRPWTS
ncbi:MAG TPA: hypothetical protein VJ794_04385 [Gemmatimonadales bacterium]|nr:hypothetical protein [Gemmatimonadales bacterium]